MNEVIKIVFLGIDNAGKTTILNILSKQHSLVSNIAPTKALGHRRTEFFGYSIVNWDVPGQERYREELTFKSERTLKDADILIFVIDVQDVERTPIAIEYFDRIFKKLEEDIDRPYIAVFIHKLDPDIKTGEVVDNVRRIQKEMGIISVGFEVEFFLTTMYIEPTLLIGFSTTVLKKFAKMRYQEELDNTVQSIADELDLNAMVILDKNYFIIHNFERTPINRKIAHDFAYSLLYNYENAKTNQLDLDEISLKLKNHRFVLLPIASDFGDFYVVGSSHTSDFSLVPIKSRLLSVLKNFLE